MLKEELIKFNFLKNQQVYLYIAIRDKIKIIFEIKTDNISFPRKALAPNNLFQ